MSLALNTSPLAWMVIADGTVDQICGSNAEARREAADLRAMGCSVTIKCFTTWLEAEAYQDRRENRA